MDYQKKNKDLDITKKKVAKKEKLADKCDFTEVQKLLKLMMASHKPG